MPARGRRRGNRIRNHKRQQNISPKLTTSHNEKYALLLPRIQDTIYDLYSCNRTHLLWIAHVQSALAPFFPPRTRPHLLHFIKTHPEYLHIHNHQLIIFSPTKQSMCELRRKCKNLKCTKIHARSNRRSFEASIFRLQHMYSINFREGENLFHDFCRGYDAPYKKRRTYKKYPRSKKPQGTVF